MQQSNSDNLVNDCYISYLDRQSTWGQPLKLPLTAFLSSLDSYYPTKPLTASGSTCHSCYL